VWIRGARGGHDHCVARSPARFDETIGEYAHGARARTERRRHGHQRMATGRHMCGHIDADVIAGRQERRDQHRGPIGRHGGEDVTRRGSDDVDERDLHGAVEVLGHPLGEIADHRDPAGFTRAVRHQQQAHSARAIFVSISVSSTANR
jgi:hypothetical protein